MQKYLRDLEGGWTLTTNEDDLIFYWRPGCGFCMALERQLSTTDMAITFRNIWEDPEAAAFVRASADGNEIVPTIEVGETVMVNPSADEVVVAVTAHRSAALTGETS
tara:strand:- start:787 stop:1107 length:321 start_codon:yes stop_codon:yes gene_type:complete